MLVGEDFVVVLDGATAPAGVDSGCRHDVRWLVETLGTELVRPLIGKSAASPADLLADAIAAVARAHTGSCDLSNPDSPSSTVAMVRLLPDRVDHLVLADSPVVLRGPDRRVRVVADDRIDGLPDHTFATVRRLRNQPGGFWVASTEPKAAYEAVSGSTDRAAVDSVAVLSDGAARYAERYGHAWEELVDVLEGAGPAALIERVRRYETGAAAGMFHGKRYDDATAVICLL